MKKTLQFLIVLIGLSQFSCSSGQPYDVTEKTVTDKINVLASDDMRGRATFSPEIDKAADFISKEFEKAKLDYFGDLSSFKQSFDMYSLKLNEIQVEIDGLNIEKDNILASMDVESLDLNSDNDTVYFIKEEDNFRTQFSNYSRSENNKFVIVHPAHEEMFRRYSRFFSRPSNKFELGKDKSIFLVLSNNFTPKIWSLKASATTSKRSLANVVGVLKGKRTDEYVLFSGHYDHIGIQAPIEGDSIANGANDDASGTTAVMELAHYFSSQEKPERSIIFVAFTAEESGGYGSKYFSEQLDPNKIMAMFNIEMIGKPAVEGPNSAWITGFDKSSFGELMQKSAEGTIYKFYPDPYPSQNLFYRSDNATLARLGVPAHSISTTPIDVDKDYHQVSDEVETLNLSHLANTIKAIAKGAEGIVSGELTPTRVDKAKVD